MLGQSLCIKKIESTPTPPPLWSLFSHKSILKAGQRKRICLFVCVDSLRPSQQFSVMSGRVFLGRTSTKQRIKCLAQGHITVPPVRLEPATPRSRVKHSTTEPPRSLFSLFDHSCITAAGQGFFYTLVR